MKSKKKKWCLPLILGAALIGVTGIAQADPLSLLIDWVEHGTALAETQTGDLKLLGWQQDEMLVREAAASDLLAA